MTPKEKHSSESYMTIDEVRHLISTVKDARDRLIIRVLYETGCSISELCNIKVSDVAGHKIRLAVSDDRTARFANISAKLAKDISSFVDGNALKRSDNLLSTRQSSSISERRVRQLIKSYTDKSGFGKINPQMFRYYHIAHAYINGVFMDTIASQLGLQRMRIFQVLEELNIRPINKYNRFLEKI